MTLQWRMRTAVVLALGVAVVPIVVGCASTEPTASWYVVSTDKPDNVVTVARDVDDTLEVRSQTGVGSAEVASTSPSAPEKLSVKFFLSGLEELRFSYGDITVLVSISSAPPNEVRQTVTQASAGTVAMDVVPGDTHWMETRIVGADGQPATIPLASGYIQVDAPADFLSSGKQAFALHWIDFYR